MKDALKELGKASKKFFMWGLHLVATPFVSAFKALAAGFQDLAEKLEKATDPVKD